MYAQGFQLLGHSSAILLLNHKIGITSILGEQWQVVKIVLHDQVCLWIGNIISLLVQEGLGDEPEGDDRKQIKV